MPTWLTSLANSAWLIDVQRRLMLEQPLSRAVVRAWEAERVLVRRMERCEPFLTAELVKEQQA